MKQGFRTVTRRVALWLFLAPYFVLSLTAPGIMPGRAVDGTLTLVICTSEGMVELAVDPATNAPLDTIPAQDVDRCLWAVAHAPDIAASPPTPIRVDLPKGGVGAALGTAVLIAAHATGLPPSTGPPTSV